jgi:AP-1 complex subunit mu
MHICVIDINAECVRVYVWVFIEERASKPPIRVNFEIPYFTVSGVQVRYLRVFEKSGYQALPWVRYITQSGNYEIRTT